MEKVLYCLIVTIENAEFGSIRKFKEWLSTLFFGRGGGGLTVIFLTAYLETLPFSWHAHHKEVAHG